MREISVREIISAIGGECISGDPETIVTGISTDSRTINTGMVFFALKGERFDGHDFLENVIASGCSAVVVSKEIGVLLSFAQNKGVAVIKITDTLIGLQDLAAYYLSQFDIIKIAVTGSTGKTTTKEMLYHILSEKYNAVRNLGNFNNLIGLPLSVFNIDNDTEVAVFEMGMDRLGEIHRMAEIIKPNLAVITNIGLSHIERLGNRKNILKAKMEIVDFFNRENILVINWDNDMLSSATYKGEYRLVTVGKTEKANFQIVEVQDFGQDGIKFTLNNENEVQEFCLSTPGIHNAQNASLALAAAMCFDISMEEAKKGLAKLTDSDKRLHIMQRQGITIIDDTYNASPDSMRAAIDVLVSISGGRKIAILGDMFELGQKEEEYHFQIGEYASHKGVDVIISVGKNAKYISEGARTGGTKAIHFEKKDFLQKVLNQWIRPKDIVLVKGSRGMAMDEVVMQLENNGSQE